MNKEELDLLEIVFTLALGECAYNDINNIQKLEDKIKTIGNLCKKQKEVIDKVNKLINHYLKNTDESGSYVETNTRWKLIPEILEELLDILKEVSE